MEHHGFVDTVQELGPEVVFQLAPYRVLDVLRVLAHHGLDAQHIASFAKIQLALLETRLAKMDLELQVSDAALAELAKVGFDPVFGARPLKRAIQQRIENPLSKLLLEGRFPPKSVIAVAVNPVLEPGVFQFSAVPQG